MAVIPISLLVDDYDDINGPVLTFLPNGAVNNPICRFVMIREDSVVEITEELRVNLTTQDPFVNITQGSVLINILDATGGCFLQYSWTANPH